MTLGVVPGEWLGSRLDRFTHGESHRLSLNTYGDKIKEGGLDWHVACMGEKRNAYMAKATIAEEKRPLGIPKRRCKYGINADLTEIGWETSA